MRVSATKPPRGYLYRWKVNRLQNAFGGTLTTPWLIVKVSFGKVRPLFVYRPSESEQESGGGSVRDT